MTEEENKRKILEAKIVINRQQALVRAVGILEELKLLIGNMVSNSTLNQTLETRKQLFKEISNTQTRFSDAIGEARREICQHCDGSGFSRYDHKECNDCWGKGMRIPYGN